MLLSILLFSAAAAPQVVDTDAWVQLRAGRMICSNPNESAKTCSAISKYEIVDGAELRETSEVLIPTEKATTVQMTVEARLEKGAICGKLALADLDKGIVRVGGTPLDAQKNGLALARLAERLAPLAGRKTCEVLRIENGRLLKYGSMEGLNIALPPKPVRWIGEDEGYRVAPA